MCVIKILFGNLRSHFGTSASSTIAKRVSIGGYWKTDAQTNQAENLDTEEALLGCELKTPVYLFIYPQILVSW